MMEDFSGLDLPPLFGGHILEAELEPGGVELGPGEVELGPGGSELLHSAEHGSGPGHEEDEEEEEEEEEEERREREKRKYLVLSKRCKEIEQAVEYSDFILNWLVETKSQSGFVASGPEMPKTVNEKILGRLHQVHRLTRRLKKERRFLMKTLNSYGDDYRSAYLTILLEDEGGGHLESLPGGEDNRPNGFAGSSPSIPLQSAVGPKKKRHRAPKEKEREAPQSEADLSVLTDPQFRGFPSPTGLSHLPNTHSAPSL